jgi:hypothetical protein
VRNSKSTMVVRFRKEEQGVVGQSTPDVTKLPIYEARL